MHLDLAGAGRLGVETHGLSGHGNAVAAARPEAWMLLVPRCFIRHARKFSHGQMKEP